MLKIATTDLFTGETIILGTIKTGAFVNYRKSDKEFKNCCNCKKRHGFHCRRIGKASGSASKIKLDFICDAWEKNPKYFT